MKQPSTLRYLLFVLLFASASACGGDDGKKQNDPQPKDGYLSASVEGVAFSQPAKGSESIFGNSAGIYIDQIVIESIPTSGPAYEILQATYQKPNGQPEDSYILVKLTHQRAGRISEYNTQLTGKLSYSLYTGSTGAFSGVRLNAGGTVEGKIEGGVFRNVKR